MNILLTCLINRLPTCFLTYGVINLKGRDGFKSSYFIYVPKGGGGVVLG